MFPDPIGDVPPELDVVSGGRVTSMGEPTGVLLTESVQRAARPY
jgi:hypothetical protein